jgi:two-component system, NtrC family, response regulator AtoC
VIRRHLDAAGTGPAGAGPADAASRNIEQLGPDTCFVSASLIMQKLRMQAALLAKADVPVLILGERGAGKYTVASLIHKLSVRSGFKLLRLNCAAMPEAVLEAELFGDQPVGQAGASRQSSPSQSNLAQTSLGKFAAGEKGTILLEEIGEMPPAIQSRLLQVLQNHEQRSPGGSDALPAEVRILATSRANLDHVLAEQRLREDLYHRLSAFTLQVPPLRQRKDEIATLLRYFMHNLARHYGLPARGFSLNMLAACQRYSWPGNLTELEAFVKRYLVAGDPELMMSEIGVDSNGRAERIPVSPAMGRLENREEKSGRETKAKPESLKSLVQVVKGEAERTAIGAALMRTGWNRKAAARLLKVSYRTLLYKIEQHQMRAPQPYLSPLPAGEFSLYGEVKGNGKAS